MNDPKELIIALHEAEAETVAAVNAIMHKYGLPYFLMEPIIDKLHRQLIDQKTAELVVARARAESKQEDN